MESVVSLTDLKYYNGKKVFVTGHTGFKGSWLITWLHQLGAIIKGYALAPEDDNSLFNIVSKHIELQSIIADVRDNTLLNKEISAFQPDFIFHFAAQPLVRRSYHIPAETFEINVIGTANLLEAVVALEKKCIVVIITTDKVYENKELDYAYKEDDRLGGYDPYSASKACAEIVVSSMRNSFFNPATYSSHKKGIVSVRAGNVIGGGDWSMDRLVPDIVRSLHDNKVISVRNPGSVRPWQHVLDPLRGYLTTAILMDKDPLRYSGSYNFGPGPEDHLTVEELVKSAIAVWQDGRWHHETIAGAVHEAGLLKLDISKAQKELGWEPVLKSKKAIEFTIDWYRAFYSNTSILEFTHNQIREFEELIKKTVDH